MKLFKKELQVSRGWTITADKNYGMIQGKYSTSNSFEVLVAKILNNRNKHIFSMYEQNTTTSRKLPGKGQWNIFFMQTFFYKKINVFICLDPTFSIGNQL